MFMLLVFKVIKALKDTSAKRGIVIGYWSVQQIAVILSPFKKNTL